MKLVVNKPKPEQEIWKSISPDSDLGELIDDEIPDFGHSGKDSGTCYILRIVIPLDLKADNDPNNWEYRQITKIGITRRTIAQRVTEIQTDFYNKYRFFPLVEPRRFRILLNYKEIEKTLLDRFKHRKCKFKKKFQGSTECFDIDPIHAQIAYDALVDRNNS